MAGAPRTLKITYGSYDVGGDSEDAILDGGYTVGGSYEATTVSFAALIFASNSTNMAIAVQAFEAAFSTPRAALQITNGAAIYLTADPSTNSGFDAVASYQKDQHAADTGLSRRYMVTITVMRPANLSGQSGRRNSTVRIDRDTSDRITITMQGEYTALGSNSAVQQFEAASPAYFAAVVATVTGTFEKVRVETQRNDTSKTLSYTAVYHEILYAQTAGGTDDTNIVEHTVQFARTLELPGDFGGTIRLTDVLATYQCSVLKANTALEALYEGSLRPYILAQAESIFSPIAIALETESPTFDKTQNKITAILRLKMAIDTTGTLQATVTEAFSDQANHALTPVHNGKPFSFHVDPGPAMRLRTTTKVLLVHGGQSARTFMSGGGSSSGIGGTSIGSGGGGGFANPGGAAPAGSFVNTGIGSGGGGTTGWVFMQGQSSSSPKTIGRAPYTIPVTEYSETVVEAWVEKP